LVPAATLQLYESENGLSKLISNERSYKVLREELRNSVPPALPYLGVYLSDLTFIEG